MEINFSTFCSLALFPVFYMEWGTGREKDPGDNSPRVVPGHSELFYLMSSPQGFQHKQWEAEEALQGIPRWRWHPYQSKLFSFTSLFMFFSFSECSSGARKLNRNLNTVIFFFACSIFCPIPCCCFLLLPPLRAGNVFGFHLVKTGKESMNAEADLWFFSLSCFWSESQDPAVELHQYLSGNYLIHLM